MRRLAVCIAVALALQAGHAAAPSADLVLYNGKVLSVDANGTVHEAVAVSGAHILAVGSSNDVLALAGPRARRVDLHWQSRVPHAAPASALRGIFMS